MATASTAATSTPCPLGLLLGHLGHGQVLLVLGHAAETPTTAANAAVASVTSDPTQAGDAGELRVVGDRVVALAPGSFATHVTTLADLTFPIPDELDLDDADGVAVAELGPEVLLLALAVVLDDAVRGVEDVLRRAVVLLERDRVGAGEVALELHDVADVRAAERVDRLVGVADDAEIAVFLREQSDKQVLCVVRILVLVHVQIAPCVLVAIQHLGHLVEEADRFENQVVEVQGVGRRQ